MRLFNKFLICAVGFLLSLGSAKVDLASAGGTNNPDRGQIYTMSNSTRANAVIVFDRDRRGNLLQGAEFRTNGRGTGGSLGNQSGVVLDQSFRWLFVVNAGDGTISSFRVLERGLQFVDRVPSGGDSPISLTVFGTWVYVLNEGLAGSSPDNISGFQFDSNGNLTPIPDSTRPLSADSTDPAQIGFNKEGTVLLITEKATNQITTYTVNDDGTPGTFRTRPAARPTPFGFSFGDCDIVYISEANQGNVGFVASYRVDRETGEVFGPAIDILEAQNAACWVVIANAGNIGYVTNTGSGTVSTFFINFDGTMSPRNVRFNVQTGDGPLDLILSRDGSNLYTLNSGDNQIRVFSVRESDGRLIRGQSVFVPPGANGLAVR